MKNKKTLAISLTCIALFAIIVARYCIEHQVDTSGLREGMTKSEIQELLGDPTSTLNNDTQWWYKDKTWIWCDVTIHFDDDGKYSSVFHDH